MVVVLPQGGALEVSLHFVTLVIAFGGVVVHATRLCHCCLFLTLATNWLTFLETNCNVYGATKSFEKRIDQQAVDLGPLLGPDQCYNLLAGRLPTIVELQNFGCLYPQLMEVF